MKLQIFVMERNTEEIEITDLYWFEENGPHWFDDKDPWTDRFTFRILVDGVEVYNTE